MIEIDATYGEGGGQLVRTAVALAAITGTGVVLTNIRAKRDPPGLAPQHLAAVRAVGELCGAKSSGLELRSRACRFAPGRLRSGTFRFDVGTAGSVTLVLQALLPVLVRAPGPSRVTVAGGTDVRAAPPIDYLRHVLLPHLGRFGASATCRVARRGYYPRGGGEIELAIQPARLHPPVLDKLPSLPRVEGIAHVSRLPAAIAERMRDAACAALGSIPANIDTAVLAPTEAIGAGGAIVVWSSSDSTTLGAGRVAERGVRAERLGAEAGRELAEDIAAGVTLDIHAADQLLVFLALAGGGSFTTRAVSSHARIAMWLIEQFLPVRFVVASAGALERIAVRPR